MRKSPADASIPLTPWPRRCRSQNHWLRRAVVFVGCALLLNAVFGDRGLAELFKARVDYRRANDALARLKKENAGLREQVRRLQEDPATIETVAREDLGLIRPGEILVRLKDPHERRPTPTRSRAVFSTFPTPSRLRRPSRP